MLEALEQKIGISFRNKDLLAEALTHRSYLNEHPDWKAPHNERLEFLGDAVLELATTEFLFSKFDTYTEGKLTRIRSALVNRLTLAKTARALGLENHLYLSKGEAQSSERAREAIIGNAVEALIGALYLDRGYDAAQRFVERFVLVYIDEILSHGSYQDPKSLLQEEVQEKLQVTPSYKVISEEGPDHDKTFVVGVYFNGDKITEGKGASKQEAERDAAEKALQTLG